MTLQLDSHEISQFKARALEYQDSLEHDGHLLEIASHKAQSMGPTSGSGQNPPAPLAAPIRIPLNDQDHITRPGSRDAAGGTSLRHSSHPKLPSTVPDSTRGKMAQSGTPSQGDTQPASQWVYDECANQTETAFQRGNGHNTRDSQGTPQDEEAKETEPIDLLAGYEPASLLDTVEGGTQFTALEDDEIDPLSQDVHAEIFPESKRFQLPKTPASQGTKRKRTNQAYNDEIQTPSLPTNPFANRGSHDMLRPSQLFQTTQAVTSPLNAVSDIPSDRPSPNLQRTDRPSSASTPSSIVKLPRSDMMRATTEPQTIYVSMKESQESWERRKAREAQERLEDLSDDDFDNLDTQLRKQASKNQMKQLTKTQFAGVSAKSQPVSEMRRRGRKPAIAHTHSSPVRSGRGVSETVIISDDPPAENVPGNVSEEETEREGDVEDTAVEEFDGPTEGNKENIEVLRTDSKVPRRGQPVVSQPTPSHPPPRKSAKGFRAYQAALATSSPTASGSPERSLSASASQAIAVADSQSSQHPKRVLISSKEPKPSHSGPASSFDSRAMVPQSQGSQHPKSSLGYTSSAQDRTGKDETHALPAYGSRLRSSSSNISKGLDSTDGELPNAIGKRRPLEAYHSEHDPRLTVEPLQGPEALPSAQKDDMPYAPFNLIPSPRSTPKSSAKAASLPNVSTASGISTLYETARELPVDTPPKSPTRILQQGLRSTRPSPSKRQSQPIRSITDIAGDPSLADAADSIDMDFGILNNQDLEDDKLISGSNQRLDTLKRRRLPNGRSTQTRWKPESLVLPSLGNRLTPYRPRTPPPPVSSALSALTPIEPSSSPLPTHIDRPLPVAEAGPESAAETIGTPIDQPMPPPLSSSPPSSSVVEKLPVVAKHPARPTINAGTMSLLRARQSNTSISLPVTAEANAAVTVKFPNRVFAHFKGGTSNYFPATCTGVMPGDESRYHVTYDDGAEDIINGYGIKRLDLRPGDVCKVETDRKRNFVVVNVQDPIPNQTATATSEQASTLPGSTGAILETDMFGHANVTVSPKQRDSVNGTRLDTEHITVPLRYIYFTQTMWTAFKNREYTFVSNKQPMLTGLQTPSERPSTPSTPSSRARRIRASGLPSAHTTHTTSITSERLFSNTSFSLTNISSSETLEHTKSAILAHGGRVLESGFDELFHVPELSGMNNHSKPIDSLQLTPASEKLGFTCLIADRHCRRAKYIQALALGIPCVATRWVHDSVAKGKLLAISPYLLPAGDSTFLGGATRSRVLHPFPDPEKSTLSSIFLHRPLILADTSILLIMHKHEEQTMKHHNFLTHALGAARVAKVPNAEAAAKAVAQAQTHGGRWDWVYTHDREKQTEKVVFGAKKRKRGAEIEKAGTERTRVVSNEFVIQSLILGQLAEG